MTLMERETQGKLRAEARERRGKGENVYIAKGKIWTRRSQHHGTGPGQATPASAERKAYTPPTLQVQANNELATQAETVFEVAQAMQAVPNDQASTPSAVQTEQVVGDIEVQEQVEVVEQVGLVGAVGARRGCFCSS
ncbi:hypothetical protein Pcinc_038509 [Petrolisthes cinctipes]|uniref:Uncharacterized protein n=1 Tax=Petrolisthes cinctipes TaxID=88211 RepID=A0AAE1BQD0_PETCI|nr:hypothetical protein Pcinc_038509 [Petrolisthes cinctipes]